ncbi:osmotically-inducible lipoprotein OsmE [Pseudomonas cavernae]|uniref:Osmotically-inducible lipoprotein OsmE n=1 Tax=Pseudomonas cavernae TaxID=2320867 RepID=A0A385Z051_9PSED|nr:osmotically-inducible lipoprotein OsmE [Pseudomonas cavernae]AYC31258.1 osmotically-inducible lipoprotein OsmE [Pseudomonas cavernae]
MTQQLLAATGLLACLAGCAGMNETYRTFADQPLVAQVHKGMSQQEVQSIAGAPLATQARSADQGTCNDYQLSKAGRQQAYHVSFDVAGRVDHTGFTSCSERESEERARASTGYGGMGGGGY